MFFDSLTHITEDGSWFETEHDASVEKLLNNCSEAGINKALLVGLSSLKNNNKFILNIHNQYPNLFVPIAGFNPTNFKINNIDKKLENFARFGFRGIKIHPRLGGFSPLDKRVLHTIRESINYNFVILICTVWGRPMPSINQPIWSAIDEICRINYEVPVIFMHGGYWDCLATSEIIKSYKNAYLDLSFTFMRFFENYKQHFEYMFNHYDEKIVIGSDFPEYNIGDIINKFNKFNIIADKSHNIMYKNMARIFNEAR